MMYRMYRFFRLVALYLSARNLFVRLGIVQAHNRLISPGETLSSMAQLLFRCHCPGHFDV